MNTASSLPAHLQKYVVEQDYRRYTPEDQAVWRFILRQLKEFLSVHAHESYLEGLKRTGISIEEIPRIEKMDALLSDFGWGAVAVSGFIPPAAFMEFQSLGILPIASDMRSLDHLLYTPAPDIVHEAAGHAPILVNPEFAAYLRKYADVAKNAIISKEDMDQYNAIRELSDIKEDPDSTPEVIAQAEHHLETVNRGMKHVSEAALLSRMNWWTAEYGLIGDLKKPRIYGAGLLSSVGESRECLSDRVKKIPLDVQCIDYSYDITEPQPQLFVARDFYVLHDILNELANKMSFRRGGLHGLQEAVKAQTVNTVQLNSGIQISGVLQNFEVNERKEPIFLRFNGACQLSRNHREWPGQGRARHAHGFSSPIGLLVGSERGLSGLSEAEVRARGLIEDKPVRLEYRSGIVLEGTLRGSVRDSGRLQILTFAPCKVTRGKSILFDPTWGEFDLAVGETVISVSGGPADRSAFGDTNDFSAKRVPGKRPDTTAVARYQFFQKIRDARNSLNGAEWPSLVESFLSEQRQSWLPGLELFELGYAFGKQSDPLFAKLKRALDPLQFSDAEVRQTLGDGLRIANQTQ